MKILAALLLTALLATPAAANITPKSPTVANPSDPQAWIAHAQTLAAQGDHFHALADLDHAARLDPRNPQIHYLRANACANLGRLAQAETAYSRSLRLDPKNPLAYINRGITRGRMNKLAPAISDFTHAIRLNPNDSAAFYNRALAYDRLGSTAKALKDYTQTLTLDPTNADALNNKGLILTHSSKLKSGCAALNDACRLGQCAGLKTTLEDHLCQDQSNTPSANQNSPSGKLLQ